MALIGSRAVRRTLARGLFQCPHCGIARAYAHKRARRFFALLHVPLVPLAGQQEYVQCGFCRRAFTPSVLGDGHAHGTSDSDPAAGPLPQRDEQLTGAAASTLLVWEADAEEPAGPR